MWDQYQKLFIVGTDTDCGKTQVTCELIKHAQRQHQTVVGLKPIASGSLEDAHRIQAVTPTPLPLSRITPWFFQEPISPHLAAQHEGREIILDEVVAYCMDASWQAYEKVLIEGAGGLLVPLNANDTWVDFLKQTQIPVLLVVGMRLGCLNHAQLTAQVLAYHGIDCIGWIANVLDPGLLFLDENIQTLQKKLNIPYGGCVPHQGELLMAQGFCGTRFI